MIFVENLVPRVASLFAVLRIIPKIPLKT